MTARTRTIWTFVITSVALFMVTLDNLVVTMALPVIREDLGASLSQLEWTVNAYTLTFAVLLLTGAALGDRFGRRRMFVVGLGDLHGRVGRGGARAEHRDAGRRARGPGPRRRDRDAADPDAPQRGRPGREARARARRLGRHRRPRRRARPARRRRDRRGHLLAVDLLAERADRPRAGPARAAPPDREPRPDRRARPAGPRPRERRPLRHRAGASSAGTASRLDEPRDPRGVRPRAVLLAAFVLWELRAPAPMLPMRFFRNRTFAAANVASLFMFFGMFGSIFLLAQFLQTVQGYSPLEAGLRMLPWTAMPIFVAPIAGALSDRIGGRPLMAVGLALQAVGARLARARHRRLTSRTRARAPVRDLRASAWPCSSRRSRTSSSRPCGRSRRARRQARTTRSASSAASSASPCSPRSSPTTAATRAPQAFVDGLTPAIWVGAAVVGLGAVAALFVPSKKRADEAVAGEPELALRAGGLAGLGRSRRRRK